MADANTRYDVGFVAPALPLPTQEYSALGAEQLNNVLRLYFNNVDAEFRRLAAQAPTTTTQTGDYTVVYSTDWVIVYVDNGATPVTVTLPSGAEDRQRVSVKLRGTGQVTIATAGAETIDGSSTLIIIAQYDAPMLVYDLATTEWALI